MDWKEYQSQGKEVLENYTNKFIISIGPTQSCRYENTKKSIILDNYQAYRSVVTSSEIVEDYSFIRSS